MQVKIKKLTTDAVIPSYATPGDAGLDITCTHITNDEHDNMVFHTGIAIEIPEGHVGLLFPRSSISKYAMHLRNSVGVIDSSYRGELILKFGYVPGNKVYSVGDKIAQLLIIPYPTIELVESEELSETQRGDKGFGSTTEKNENS
jgi:dUTP pyrophosphatase